MATFQINTAASTGFSTEQRGTVSTSCKDIYEFEIVATNSDIINVYLSGYHQDEVYILNGITSSFSNTVLGIVYNTSLIINFSIENSAILGVFRSATLTITNSTTSETTEYTVTRNDDGLKCEPNYGVFPPQLFNPNGSEVTSGTINVTLLLSTDIIFVSINGQVIDDTEYSKVGNILTVTPDNGFDDIDDEILVFQNRL